jgi:transcription elongation factor Elf1
MKTTKRKTKCQHQFKEDPMFADGMVTLVTGTPQMLTEETLMVCEKCGKHRYVKIKNLGSLLDIYHQGIDD